MGDAETTTIGNTALGVASLKPGAIVRVETAQLKGWSGRVTFVSDRIVGVRGYLNVDGIFRARDLVTLKVGSGPGLICCRARVLAATGPLLRVVRRDASEEHERRRAPRLRVELSASIAPDDADADRDHIGLDAEVIDLSSLGCALRCAQPLAVGSRLVISMSLGDSKVDLAGSVVRTWTGEHPRVPHGGIEFEAVSAATKRLIEGFLVTQLRSRMPPASPAAPGREGP